MKKILVLLIFIFSIEVISQGSLDQSYLNQEFLEGLPPAIREQIEGQNQINEEEDLEKLFRSDTSIEKNKILLQKIQDQLVDLKKSMSLDSDIENKMLSRFGDSFFRTLQSSFMPINIGNLGSSYIVDVGDSFNFFMTGKVELNEVLMVQRDGSLVIPTYGKVYVAGLSLIKAEETVQNFVDSISIGVNAFLSLKSIRDVQVLITGGVENPGIYTLSGGSNILGALNVSGGISKSGSFRNIDLKRGGKIIQSYDLYDIFVYGNFDEKVTLRSGDTLFVHPSSAQIPVSGAVSYEAIFEIKKNETIKDLIEFAGGFSEGFSDYEYIQLQRVTNKFNSIQDINIDSLDQYTLKPRDSIFVPLFHSEDNKIKSVSLTGMVNRPGEYFINEGETLKELIDRAGGLKNNAYIYGAALFRQKAQDQEQIFAQVNYSDSVNFIISNAGQSNNLNKSIIDLLTEELRSRNLPGRVVLDFNEAISGKLNNFALEDGDKIVIPSMERVVYLFGDFRNPSNLSYDSTFNVKNYIDLVGGVKDSAFNELIVIDPDGKSHVYKRTFFDRSDIEIYPGSIIYAPRDIGKLTGIQYASSISPILSSLAISLASLNSIKN
jgi:polysaccharide export outer membrane protein